MWEGRTVAILASGPSMSQAVADKIRASKLPTIVINDTHRLAPWADALYACDSMWWLYHAQSALKFAGLKITQDTCVPFPQVLCVPSNGADGFEPDPSRIRTGHNSGYQALHIAIHAGACRVLLCGFDMRVRGLHTHWFGNHPPQLVDSDAQVFSRRFIPSFEKLAPLLVGLGVEVLNCTEGSALTCFPMRDLDSALSEYSQQ
jgi:hypothetical protein